LPEDSISEELTLSAQADSDLLQGMDAGAPPPVAAGDFAFEPMYVEAKAVGNLSGGSVPSEVGTPAHFITLSFPAPLGRKEKKLEYKKGLSLKHYLRDQRLIGRRCRCVLLNGKGKKVRLNYVPEEREIIRLNLVGRSMS
jgi:hypothetical protein